MRWLGPSTLLCVMLSAGYSSATPELKPAPAALCTPCIPADMNFLASDALRGRGSGTRDEYLAALFAASLFASFGLQPGGDHGSFLQRAPLPVQALKTSGPELRGQTWNVVGILPGGDPAAAGDAILLTAHLDHLGIGTPRNGDSIYNGADDDASGTTAVLELARVFAGASRPPRTLIFALFGAEELGGYGNQYFLKHPPVPLERVVANLEFEMIGRRDPVLPGDGLWMTGFSRSDLGPVLKKHGAALVADPHPRENFFKRSDNFALARRGVVAHTVSSFGLHADYHQPSDELSKIDFAHLTWAIRSMIEPIAWLSETQWKPRWLPGGQP